MDENNTNKDTSHKLISGAEAHTFTQEERSRGGKASTFGALKHGKYAQKLSQKYVCPNCGTPIPAGKMKEQDALLMRLSKREGVYEEIKKDLVALKELIDCEEELRPKAAMIAKRIEILLKLLDKDLEQLTKDPTEKGLTIKDLMAKIMELPNEPETVVDKEEEANKLGQTQEN